MVRSGTLDSSSDRSRVKSLEIAFLRKDFAGQLSGRKEEIETVGSSLIPFQVPAEKTSLDRGGNGGPWISISG